MNKLFAASLKKIKTQLRFAASIIRLKVLVFLSFSKLAFTKYEIYLLAGLCILTCISSSVCFKNSSVLNAWAESFLNANAIIDNNYSHYTIQSSLLKFETNDQFRSAMDDLKNIHNKPHT